MAHKISYDMGLIAAEGNARGLYKEMGERRRGGTQGAASLRKVRT